MSESNEARQRRRGRRWPMVTCSVLAALLAVVMVLSIWWTASGLVVRGSSEHEVDVVIGGVEDGAIGIGVGSILKPFHTQFHLERFDPGFRWWFEVAGTPGGTQVIVPLWPFVVALLVLAWWWRPRPVRVGTCAACGYDVRGSDATCPECGTRVTPAAREG